MRQNTNSWKRKSGKDFTSNNLKAVLFSMAFFFFAAMVELAYTADLKSVALGMRVQIPLAALFVIKTSPIIENQLL